MDPNLILRAGQTADIMGSVQQGNALAAQVGEQRRQNALAEYSRENGAGIMAGDMKALAGLAGFDPQMAMNMGIAHQNNRRADAQLELQRERYGVQDSQWQKTFDANQQKIGFDRQQTQQANEREAQAAEAERIAKIAMTFHQRGDQQGFAQWVQSEGGNPADYPWDSIPQKAAEFMSWAELQKGQQGAEFRPATAEEAGRYGAQAGQFGPDGRFYPASAPSGLAIETGPDGQVRVTQGAGAQGAAGKPFTEGQSKDIVFATRAQGALDAFEPYADSLTSRGERAAEGVPLGLGRELQTPEFQMAKNAGDEFLQAILRKDTGAAITAQEQALYGQTYLPQPGDGAEVLTYKRAARQRAVAALKGGMSPAQIVAQEMALSASSGGTPAAPAPPPSGQPQPGAIQPGATEDGYRFKGGDPSDPNNWEQVR